MSFELHHQSVPVDCAAYKDLHELYCEWVDGIEMADGRIAPLRELERLKRQEGLEWRSSSKIRKQIMERKVLMYAVLRRLPDPASELSAHGRVTHAYLQHSLQPCQQAMRLTVEL